jgi:hypothetical protein
VRSRPTRIEGATVHPAIYATVFNEIVAERAREASDRRARTTRRRPRRSVLRTRRAGR